MTENEASKIIGNIPVAQADCDNMGEIVEAYTVAQKALEEIQQYRAIETELREKYHANVDIKMLMQHFIETIFKGEKHEGFCILTNEDAEWYKNTKNAEEQGLLLRLPCKVGTHIYIMHHYWIDEGIICGLAECDDVDCACFKVYEDPDTYTMVAFNEFGVTWFLSAAEAEKALQERYKNDK